MKQLLLILFLSFILLPGSAQTDAVKDRPVRTDTPLQPGRTAPSAMVITDSSLLKDSLGAAAADSLRRDSLAAIKKMAGPMTDTSTYRRYEAHAYLPFQQAPVYMIIDYHRSMSKDDLFYLLCGVLFFLAFIKVVFPRYFRNLFIIFFQTSLRQKQTIDQLLQDRMASLLSNLLFVLSASLYAALVIRYRQWAPLSFWWLTLYCAAVLVLIYFGKYLFMLFAGWVFNTKEAAGSYTFIVFFVNKMMGILLVPFLLLFAFANESLAAISFTVSLGVIGLMFIYRYLVSFGSIRNTLKVNALHFLLYLFSVEILPLLLIYKVLINYISRSS